ncbi:hypothetical protein B296_00052497 [Ensete ventricosum]|uniref:Uncharacterized protein n=1 Tax=Ensete ventricosum TaxID=4639 RepID=A0A426WYG5_ENSVE|nr:hypothetical protein B296_00052497 [Ensete ventricosum]
MKKSSYAVSRRSDRPRMSSLPKGQSSSAWQSGYGSVSDREMEEMEGWRPIPRPRLRSLRERRGREGVCRRHGRLHRQWCDRKVWRKKREERIAKNGELSGIVGWERRAREDKLRKGAEREEGVRIESGVELAAKLPLF